MKYRTFGRAGWQVGEIGFGGWQLDGNGGHVDESEALRTLHHAYESGINFVDAADLPDDTAIRAILQQTLHRLQDFGVQAVVLFRGHFADEQVALVEDIAATWSEQGGRLRVVPLAVNMPVATGLEPDHAGILETTLLAALWPDRVRLDLLRDPHQGPSPDPEGDERGSHRHEPSHPLDWVFGPRPRYFDTDQAQPLLDAVVDSVASRVTTGP